MAAYFFDTSALAKKYIIEPGSAWVDNLIDPASGHRLYLARITGTEVVAAIARRARGGSLSVINAAKGLANFKHDYTNAFNFVEVDSSLISSSMLLAEFHTLRGYDAVQLAAAMQADGARHSSILTPLTFVCADNELLDAAQAEGLLTENPNNH